MFAQTFERAVEAVQQHSRLHGTITGRQRPLVGDVRIRGAHRCERVEEAVVLVPRPDRDTNAGREGAHHDTALFQRNGEIARLRPGRQPPEVALRLGQTEAAAAQDLGDATALGNHQRAAPLDLVALGQCHHRSGLGRTVDCERDQRRVHRGDDRRVGDQEPDAQRSHAVSLRQRAQDDDVRMLVEIGQCVGYVGAGHELAVGLVDDQQARTRHLVDQALHVGPAQRARHRVVRVGDEDDLRPLRDRGEHSVDIDRLPSQRHHDLLGHHDAGELRVGDEARPRVQHLVARTGVGECQLLQQPDRAGSNRDVIAGHADRCCVGSRQIVSLVIGVAICIDHRPGHGLGHAGKRAERHLVGGHLRRLGDAVLGHRRCGASALGVDRDVGEMGTRRGCRVIRGAGHVRDCHAVPDRARSLRTGP